MNSASAEARTSSPHVSWICYVAPFAAFIAFMALDRIIGMGARLYPFRVVVVGGLLLALSRKLPWKRPSRIGLSALLGVAVYAIWVGPDVLWPGYRFHWIFQNGLLGKVESTLPVTVRSDMVFIFFRVLGCAILVPVMEEVFWRGWLMRWLIRPEFWTVPLGEYTAASFWIGAALFASEHGPYWEVGLVAGVAYGWWMVKTRNLTDCVVAHSVTNTCLSLHVLLTGEWHYWF
jgi:uncharacterized protein